MRTELSYSKREKWSETVPMRNYWKAVRPIRKSRIHSFRRRNYHMAKQEYTIGDHDQKSQHAPGPGRHGMVPGEKANDLGQTMKKLVAYCNRYIPVILTDIVL